MPLITREMGTGWGHKRELGFSMYSQRLLLSGVPTPSSRPVLVVRLGAWKPGGTEPGCWLHMRPRAHQLQQLVIPRWALQLCQVVIKLPGVLCLRFCQHGYS